MRWLVLNALILALNEEQKHSDSVSASLRKSGHTVILAKNFSEAIAILNLRHVDMIISDVHLQNGGNVFDFLRWVKKNPSTLDTPFVLFCSEPTALAKFIDDGLRTSARLLGAAMYITMESFDEDEFRRLIDSLFKPLKDDGQPVADDELDEN